MIFHPQDGTYILGSSFDRLITTYRTAVVPQFHEDHGVIRHHDSWMLLEVEGDIQAYYASIVRREFGVKLQTRSLWPTHVSVIRGETISQGTWGEHEGKVVPFQYSHDIYTNGTHWWLNVECQELEDIRSSHGLQSTPGFLHLTIGRL